MKALGMTLATGAAMKAVGMALVVGSGALVSFGVIWLLQHM